MSYDFTERGEHEKEFARAFKGTFAPRLSDLEKTRKPLLRRAIVKTAAWASVFTCIGILQYTEKGLSIGALWLVLGPLFGLTYWRRYNGDYDRLITKKLVSKICSFGRMTYGQSRLSMADFNQRDLLPSHGWPKLFDQMEGVYRGCQITMAEARMIKRISFRYGGWGAEFNFRSLLFTIELKNPAPHIYLARGAGDTGNWLNEVSFNAQRGKELVPIVDVEFTKVFKVYSDDPEAAQQYLTPQIRHALLTMREIAETGGDNVAATLQGDMLYLVAPRKHGLVGKISLRTPLTQIEPDLHQALSDITLPRRVIDELAK